MSLAETVRPRYPVGMSMFEPANMVSTLARHNIKPSMHLAVPALQKHNLKKGAVKQEDVLRSVIFKGLLEEQALYTAFSSFCQPKSTLLPLSVRGVCRDYAQYVDADPTIWSSVSGMQHSPNCPHPELIKLWIRRAGTLPLSFHIALRQHHTDREQWEDEKTLEILGIFLRHAERWENIAFELDDNQARTYVNYFADERKPRPRQLKHLELSAAHLTDMDVANSLFDSVKNHGDTVTKFFWGCPAGFTPSATITLSRVTVLCMDMYRLDDGLDCLSMLRMPALEELRICFIGDRGFNRWSDLGSKPHPLTKALRKLARMPTRLYIQDDEMDSEDVNTLIRLMKENGIMTLGLLVPEPEMVCKELIAENATFIGRLMQGIPHIRECRVMRDDDGSIEIDL